MRRENEDKISRVLGQGEWRIGVEGIRIITMRYLIPFRGAGKAPNGGGIHLSEQDTMRAVLGRGLNVGAREGP